MWMADGGSVSRGELASPDSYMRVVRTAELAGHGNWYNDAIARGNAPYGELSHWTRPMDALLLAGARAAQPFVGFDRALEGWAMAIGPVLHAATVLTLIWAVAPLMRTRAAWVGVLLPFQLLLGYQFVAGRADHHGLVVLLVAGALGAILRSLRPGASLGWAALAGMISALAAWAGMEGLAALVIAAIAYSLIWLSDDAAIARPAFMFFATAAASLACAVLAERPPVIFFAEVYDAVSVAHVFAIAATASAWLACGLLSRFADESALKRIVVFGFAAWAAASATLHLYPSLIETGAVAIDTAASQLWLADLHPSHSMVDIHDLTPTGARLLMYLGPLLLALPYLGYISKRERVHPRRGWLLVAYALALTVPLAVSDLRWAPLAQMFLVVPYAALAGAAAEKLRPRSAVGAAFATAAAGLVLTCGFIAAGTKLAGASAGLSAPGTTESCDVRALAQELERERPERTTVLTFISYGPELLYRTPHAIVASPSTRDVSGMLDTIDFFSADELPIAHEVVRRRGVDLVLVCPSAPEATAYRLEKPAPSLLHRLEIGRPPYWLRKLPPRAFQTSGFIAYRVRK